MIEARALSAWDGLVASTAVLALIILAFCVMVSAVKPEDIPRHLGAIVGMVVLLIILPAIIVSLWHAMSLGQHLGIIAFGAATVFLEGFFRRRPTNAKRR